MTRTHGAPSLARRRAPRALAGLAALAGALALGGCGATAPRPGGLDAVAPVGSSLIPSAAVALALAASLELDHGGAVADAVVPRRLARLGRDLVRLAGGEPGSVTVLADPRRVGRALPGGHLQVSRGLLAELADEDSSQPEVAAALAHLAAHAALAHPTTQLGRALRRARVEALPARVAPLAQGAPEALADAPALGAALRALRTLPLEGEACAAADRLARGALRRAGYPERALERAYARLAARELADPAGTAPWVEAHGSAATRRAVARSFGAARALAGAPAAEPLDLDLSPLVAADRDAARAAAARRLVRPGLAREAAELAARSEQGAVTPVALARVHLAGGDAAEAEGALREALLARPDDLEARALLGALYLEQGRAGEAARELEEATRRAPLRAELHLLLARCLEGEAARLRLELARALAGPHDPVGLEAALRLAGGATAPAPARARVGRPRAPRGRVLGGG